MADRRLPAGRLAEAYEFCNAWNHDRILPKGYVHEADDGDLIMVGEVATDLEHGVAGPQLAALIDVTIGSGVQMAQAVFDLP